MTRTDPTYPDYDAQTAVEVNRRLRKLSQAELAKLESYERQGRGRATVLARIAALRGDAPWSGYDDMEAEEVNEALKKRDGETVRAVLDYERQHKARTTIIEFAERKRDALAESAAAGSRGKAAGKTSTRSAGKRTSASSSPKVDRQAGSRSSGGKARGSSRQPSTSGRSTKAAQSQTRARKASRPSATSSSSSRRGKDTQVRSRSKSRSSGASRSRSSSGARPSRARFDKRAGRTAPAVARRRATAPSAASSAEKAAETSARALAAVAETSRKVVRAVQETGHTVGNGGKKGKSPALRAGEVAVAVRSGIVRGSKLLPKRTSFDIPSPRRQGRLGQAAPTSKTPIRDAKLVQLLNEAYAKERQLEHALQAHVQVTTRDDYAKRLEDHLKETQLHATQVSRRIEQLGGNPETVYLRGANGLSKAAVGASDVVAKAKAAAQGPLNPVRASGEQDRMLRNARTEYQEAAHQIVIYTVIDSFATAVGDTQTARLARDILRQEERMQEFLAELLPQLSVDLAHDEVPVSEISGPASHRTAADSKRISR